MTHLCETALFRQTWALGETGFMGTDLSIVLKTRYSSPRRRDSATHANDQLDEQGNRVIRI